MAFGSCFVENIGEKLSVLKYSVDVNPFGIQYNPSSIGQGLERLLSGNHFKETELFEYQGIWHSFYHHSDFSGRSRENCLLKINSRLESAASNLLETDFLLLTLGTAWVFALSDTDEVVNNCHKLPAVRFKRYRLSVDEVVEKMEISIQKLIAVNPNVKIIMTVSPIRHLKDGFNENQLSKATLLLACEKLSEKFSTLSYFPSYELMMDDLRDYRFYKSDLIHPNEQAIDYIWEKFETAFLDNSEAALRKDIEKLSIAAAHRVFNPQTAESRQFAQIQLQKIDALKKSQPYLNFETEEKWFNSLINIQ